MSFCKGREEIRSANHFSSGFVRAFSSWNVWLLQTHLQTAIPPTSQKPLQIVVLYKAAIQMMHRLSMTCPWPIPAPHNISPIAFPTREYISAVGSHSLLTCPSPLMKQGNMIWAMRYVPDSQDACTFPWAHTQRSWHHWKICRSCASISSSKKWQIQWNLCVCRKSRKSLGSEISYDIFGLSGVKVAVAMRNVVWFAAVIPAYIILGDAWFFFHILFLLTHFFL